MLDICFQELAFRREKSDLKEEANFIMLCNKLVKYILQSYCKTIQSDGFFSKHQPIHLHWNFLDYDSYSCYRPKSDH